MLRRVLIGLCCILAPLLAGAVVPWDLTSAGVSAVSDRFKDLYGLHLSIAGRSTIAFLPVPRLNFEDVALTTPDGAVVARGGSMRAEFRMLPALAGRLELSELAITNAALEVDMDREDRNPWNAAIVKLRKRIETQASQGHIKRLVLNGTSLRVFNRRTGSATELSDVSLIAAWPATNAPLRVSGSAVWRDETVTLVAASVQLDALTRGQPSRLYVQMNAPAGRLAFAGDLSLGDDPRLSGRAHMETPSLRRFCRWSGLHLPLGDLPEPFALDSEVVVDRQGASWPTAQLKMGSDRLNGALYARRNGARTVIAGTLATDRLDLTAILTSFSELTPTTSLVSLDERDSGQQGRPDLDLRLSASTLRVGSLRMQDLAANISVTPGRYEISIGRIAMSKGSAKGRAVLASTENGLDLKGQATFERLDLGTVLSEIGRSRWIGGSAQGQFTLESSGETPTELMHRLQGRANVTIQQGELVGINSALRRIDKGPAPIPPQWNGGRVPFEQAHLNLVFSGGAVHITDGDVTAADLRAALQGRVSMSSQNVALKADVESAPAINPGSSSTVTFDINGPWNDLTIVSRQSRSSSSASVH